MRLSDLDLLHFLPAFMREDSTSKGFAYAIQNQLNKVIMTISNAQIYTNISTISDTVLDELAVQFNIPEYQSTLDISTKRLLIKNCLQVHKKRGTPASVAKVVNDIFGDGYIEEWFDYGGDPYHFRVVTSNPSVNTDQANLFVSVVDNVKRGSTIMDAVVVDMLAQYEAYYAIALQIGEFYTMKQEV